MVTVVSFAATVSSHNTLYSPFEREHVALREQITAAKEATLTATPLTERKKIIHLSLVVPKIQFHLILLWKAKWHSVAFPIDPNQRYIAILNKWRYQYTEQEKRIKCRLFTMNWYLGVKLIFFSDSHLAPKFFKVVANSKKVGRHFQRQTKPFFTLSAF